MSRLQPGKQLEPGQKLLIPVNDGQGSMLQATVHRTLGLRGRSGYVYEATIGDNRVAIKVFHRTSPESAVPPQAHLNELFSTFHSDTSGRLPEAAYPTTLALDPESHERVGIVMQYYDVEDGEYFSVADFEQSLAKENPEIARLLSLDIIAAVMGAHSRGLMVGDISDSNILISSHPRVVWLDVDSWGTSHRDPALTSDGYTLPTRLRNSTTEKFQDADRFAATILVAQLLSLRMTHPFGPEKKNSTSTTVQDRIESGEIWFEQPKDFLADTVGWPAYPDRIHRDLLDCLSTPDEPNFYGLYMDVHDLNPMLDCAECSIRHFDGGCPSLLAPKATGNPTSSSDNDHSALLTKLSSTAPQPKVGFWKRIKRWFV